MMGKRRIGDIYKVALGEGKAAYFQHICNDETQLNSAVIRIFSHIFSEFEKPELSKLAENGVMFHAHVFIKAGYILKVWHKVGHLPPPTDTDVVFRTSRDYGSRPIGLSNDWEVWQTNGPRKQVGRLPDRYHDAEIGSVWPPQEIVKRILTGSYSSYMSFR